MWSLCLLIVSMLWRCDVTGHVVVPAKELGERALGDTELLLAFVINRHGDRTPDLDELALYSTDEKKKKDRKKKKKEEEYKDVFFPYGTKALTNKGKQRGFLVGHYLRQRYDGFVSPLYLPDETTMRTTDFARTKMTALTALSALYPPLPAQQWNPALDWQPIPYDTEDSKTDDLLYWYNCPRYLHLRDQVYKLSEIKALIQPYQSLFTYLTEKTGNNITTPEDVFFLDNLFQALENVGVKTPKWAEDVMPHIKKITKIEYLAEFFIPELTKLASGVMMSEIVNATNSYIAGDKDQPKLRLYSAHENNVAAVMAAARVFKAHQPNYGATFSLELRRFKSTGQYGITAVYAKNAGGPGEILPIDGCDNQLVCDYDTFVNLVQDVICSQDEFMKMCPITV